MIFLLDNYDSFTYNLYQYFGEIGEQVIVKRRDECTLEEIENLLPEIIVISPGPCTPSDAQLSLDVIEHFKNKIPILGVCLGHQAIGQVFGGNIIRAKKPVHGKTSLIQHDGTGAFLHLPNPLTVTRYHSLIIERETLPNELMITAETEEGEIMGIRHKTLPLEGVQFHPEAILTSSGHDLLRNAIENARKWNKEKATDIWKTIHLPIEAPPDSLFQVFKNSPFPFLLASGENYPNLGQYTFMGAFPFLQVSAYKDKIDFIWPEKNEKETINPTKNGSLPVLDELYSKFHVPSQAPFPFSGGAVGFFSYDLKDEIEDITQDTIDDLSLPFWRLSWYDGIIIYDHKKKKYFITACGMTEDGQCKPSLATKRIEHLKNHIEKNYPSISNGTPKTYKDVSDSYQPLSPIYPEVSKEQYLDDLRKVIEYIFDGDIYQANLTQRFSISWNGDPWILHQKLHKYNPAPFSAFLPYSDFQILSSSPERFIKIFPDGKIETRPIKGTRPRSSSLDEDEALATELFNSSKDRAELTMIIDLERNDLGRICDFGTVKVPELICLEKYPTVWHLVSTVNGKLRTQLLPSEIIKAIFPGGSITGAPKIRAMEIIEELEIYKRGIYTGSIGYIGFDGGWDLNIVIRTILIKDGKAYIHAGGGIVADSVPESEYIESLDKARALFDVLEGSLQDE